MALGFEDARPKTLTHRGSKGADLSMGGSDSFDRRVARAIKAKDDAIERAIKQTEGIRIVGETPSWPDWLNNFVSKATEFLQPFVAVMQRYYGELKTVAEVFRALKPFGAREWAVSTYGLMMAPEAHGKAIEALPNLDEGDLRLEEGWSDPEVHQAILALIPYVYAPEDRAIATRRQELLQRASDHIQAGAYEEAVLLIYSQLDGIFQDAADRGQAGFRSLFSGAGKAKAFVKLFDKAEVMSGTEEEFFLRMRKALSRPVKKTTLDDRPSRHGVLHGRVLGYGNRRRAAQGFAFLAAALEVLIALEEDGPLMTDEEAFELPFNETPEGLQFILAAMWWSPVRAVYLAGRDKEADLLLTSDQDPSGSIDGPALGREESSASKDED